MPTQTSTKTPSRMIETIFVGAAMKQVSAAIMDDDVPVRARHMRSIDDLLMYIEDNEVECAVVDQSLPTESRGLKLVLLAGVKTVQHLIVVAPQASRAEIEAIDGVHQVLPSPATSQQVIDAVLEHAKPAAPAGLPIAATINTLAPPVVAMETGSSGIAAKISGYHGKLQEMTREIRLQSPQHYWTQTTKRFVTRPAIAAAASAFLCLGAVSAVSLASGSFTAPVKATSQLTVAASEQAVALPVQAAPDEVRQQADQLTPSLHRSMPALAAAELSRLDARFRLLVSRRTIDLEISKQQKLKQQFVAHIAHLKSITAELKATGERSSEATDTTSSLSAHTRAAVLGAELALQELEVGKIDTFLAHLNMLKSGIDLPEDSSLKLAGVNSATTDE